MNSGDDGDTKCDIMDHGDRADVVQTQGRFNPFGCGAGTRGIH